MLTLTLNLTLIDERINILWYIYIGEYYSETKGDEVLVYAM